MVGNNLNLTSEYMAYIQRQGIDVDANNNPDPKKNLPQLEEDKSCRLVVIICLGRSNNLHNTYAYSNNYYCGEVMKMTKLELFFVLFTVDYLKEILILEIKCLLKHPMDLGDFICCMGYWFYMGCWVGIFNRGNWWSTA